MLAIRKMKPARGFDLVEKDIPNIGENDLLLKVKACSVCGTDLHIYNWEHPWDKRVKPPITIGHEFAGEVVEMGRNVRGFEIGDNVSAESHIPCGYCHQCRTDMQHICSNLKILGVDTEGGFADYVSIPQSVAWKNPKGMSPQIACIQEPFGNAVYTVSSTNMLGKTVAVFGCGPIGLFSIGIARAGGATKIIAISGTDFHTQIAKKMGADIVLNRHDVKDMVKELKDLTDGIGVDVMLEMSGSGEALNQGLKSLKKGGEASVLGLPKEQVAVDWSNDIVLKDIRIHGVAGRLMYKTWFITSRLLSSGRVNVEPVITHKVKFQDFQKGIEDAIVGKAGKVVLLK